MLDLNVQEVTEVLVEEETANRWNWADSVANYDLFSMLDRLQYFIDHHLEEKLDSFISPSIMAIDQRIGYMCNQA
ncbi:hypothetical protein [Bacillus sp. FJAT-44742]|uniref:hypothetical protein n=1 Tax=Bacillus sp. FJAT-44742 TaxID=2014005 RepID=UPI000C24A9BE|nr:hypothetical protein [Bacillus sp. FJAT-44742]